MQAGLDSLGAVELRSAVCSAFGVDLAATFVFDYPTVAAMADYLTAATAPSAPEPALAVVPAFHFIFAHKVQSPCGSAHLTRAMGSGIHHARLWQQ